MMLSTRGSHGRPVRQSGFTIVELVVVIVIAGIMAAAVGTRFFDRKSSDSRSFTDQAGALLRYAQKIAIAQSRDVWVVMAGNGIKLCYTKFCNPSEQVAAPGGSNSATATTNALCGGASSWACEAPPAGTIFGSTINFYFDAAGKPFAEADGSGASTSTFARLNVAVKTAGQADRAIVIEAETGYVH